MIDYDLINKFWKLKKVAFKKDFQKYCGLKDVEVDRLIKDDEIKIVGKFKNKLVIQKDNYFNTLVEAMDYLKYLTANEFLIVQTLDKYKFITKKLIEYLLNCNKKYSNKIVKSLIDYDLIKEAINHYSKDTIYVLTSKGFAYLGVSKNIYKVTSLVAHELYVLEVAIFLSKKHELNIIIDFNTHKELWQPLVNVNSMQLNMIDDFNVPIYVDRENKKQVAKYINASINNQYIPDLRINKLELDVEVELSHKKNDYMRKKYEKGNNTIFFVFNLKKRNPLIYANIYTVDNKQKETYVYDLESKELLVTTIIDKIKRKILIYLDARIYDLEFIKKQYLVKLNKDISKNIELLGVDDK